MSLHPRRRDARTSSTSRPCCPRCATAPSSATSGKKYAGADLIGRIWDRAVADSLGAAPAADTSTLTLRRGRARPRRPHRRRRPPRASSTRSARSRRPTTARRRGGRDAMKFGIFYEHQLPRPWDEDSERQLIQDALDQVELADRLGFDVRVGGRAPLPRGVLALVGARGVPRRRQPAHQEHPPRPRHHPDRARLQPPGPHRRAHRHARPGVERPGRVRLGRVVVGGRAGRLRHRPGRPSGSSGWRASRSPSAA